MLTPTQRNDLGYWTQDKYGIPLGATPSSVQPEDIPDAAAVWVADDIAQSDGTAIASWIDRVQGIAAAQGTGSLQPIYRTTGINSQPVADYDGVDDQLVTASTVSHRESGHIFAVVRARTITTPAQVWVDTSDVDRLYFGSNNWGTGAPEFQHSNGSYWFHAPPNSMAAATDYLMELNSDGSTWEIRINGVVQSPLTAVNPRTNDGLWFDDLGANPLTYVGGGIGSSAPIDGYIAAVMIYGADVRSRWHVDDQVHW